MKFYIREYPKNKPVKVYSFDWQGDLERFIIEKYGINTLDFLAEQYQFNEESGEKGFPVTINLSRVLDIDKICVYSE